MAKDERVIDRIDKFYAWCKAGGLCKNRSDFERQCGLSNNYIYNTHYNTKNNVGVETVRKIHEAYPMLNVTWMVMGVGSMITSLPDEGYREGYMKLKKQIEELQKYVSKMGI